MVPIRVTDTRDVLLKCRHSMLSMIRYDAAAGHVVLVECHLYSFSSGCFQWFGLTAVVVVHWSCEVFFWVKINIFYTSRYLVLILLWIIIFGWYSTQAINTRTKKCRKYIHACCFRYFFCPILVYFLRMTLSSSLPFVTHIRGHMTRTPLPSPLPCLPSSF